MSQSIEQEPDRRHLSLRETKPRMAKAHLTKCETQDEGRRLVGAVIVRTRKLLGWDQKELAAKVGYDRTQVAKWESGAERPHIDALLRVPEVPGPFARAFAELAARSGAAVTVETVVRIA